MCLMLTQVKLHAHQLTSEINKIFKERLEVKEKFKERFGVKERFKERFGVKERFEVRDRKTT